jgi:hypothetical protein
MAVNKDKVFSIDDLKETQLNESKYSFKAKIPLLNEIKVNPVRRFEFPIKISNYDELNKYKDILKRNGYRSDHDISGEFESYPWNHTPTSNYPFYLIDKGNKIISTEFRYDNDNNLYENKLNRYLIERMQIRAGLKK